MFKRNHMLKTIAATSIAVVSFAALSQQTEQTTASVTVQNAFTLTEDAALSFGTITASVFSTASTYEVNADGTFGNTGDNIRVLNPGSPASYTVAAAAPFADLQVRTLQDSVDLENSVAPPGSPVLTLDTFTISDGTLSGTVNSAADSIALATDVNGTVTFTVGGTITLAGDITVANHGPLVDGDYEGTFSIEVSY
ncbi:DUF4402 domain-containing protein [Glaciecola sp. MH2013]|uniref:DUF4402 domain-containing protein n=1 Tax=Glaciecola sp. MH2013 TaxID=2785524 RepID=UPI00189D025C|nr:DUF4402 domain-containing protein [Glaciecola sp. MH2013]MBF7072415.1 DUF4402 domain-containing protein [Glaciecola sp. MH2013]